MSGMDARGLERKLYFFPRLLDYVAIALMLAGFWIKPACT